MKNFLLAISKHSYFLLIGVIFLMGVSFFAGTYIGFDIGLKKEVNAEVGGNISLQNDPLVPVGVDLTPLWKAWHTLNEKYVPATTTDIIGDEDKVWGMIKGLSRSLGDPYTVFLPPEDAAIFEDDISGNFEGVGMEIGMRDNGLTIIAPLKGTPADKAGVQSGDHIIKIDDTFTDTLGVDGAVKLIRGPRGTPVLLTIARDGEVLEIEIVRAVIEIPTIGTEFRTGDSGAEGEDKTAGLRDDGIFIIELFNFSAISPGLFQNALRQFIESGSNKLVLDLRGNPGGFLEASVDMASWFLPIGKIVVTEDFGDNGKPRIHRSKGYNVFSDSFSLEMIVLVNQGSASASEILAGALKEHGVATVVGETTFGKGSVQELVKITPETSLKVTVARWLTPNGNTISDGGLTPDIVVEMTSEDIEAGTDPQIERAIELLTQN